VDPKHHGTLLDKISSVKKELQSLELLESRLRRLKLSLAMVKAEGLNTLAPIHSLPPENFSPRLFYGSGT
jgi:hypothetical protein